MIDESRPYASLSSGLLARKGTAKPAMRPQGFTGFEDLGWNDMGHDQAPPPYEQGLSEHVPSSISALTPAPKGGRGEEFYGDEPNEDIEGEGPGAREEAGEFEQPAQVEPFEDAEEPEAAEEPHVVAQQRAIAETFAAEDEPEAEAELPARESEARVHQTPAEVVALPKRSRPAAAVQDGRKSAFTLRLDAGRHLRLRLATAVTGRSAQQIVTGALDAILDSIPELEALAERVPTAKAKRN
ncbi:MAG TPA: hypothetical protein VIT38_06100 [Allosphingosinicella sp.]